jgi:hypothetical protein
MLVIEGLQKYICCARGIPLELIGKICRDDLVVGWRPKKMLAIALRARKVGAYLEQTMAQTPLNLVFLMNPAHWNPLKDSENTAVGQKEPHWNS